jgi:hypothetical protein
LRPERAQKIWQTADAFDTAAAEWMPYSIPEKSAFRPEDSRVLASAFVHPGKRALAFVVNWSDEPASGVMAVDFARLGLPADSAVRVLDTGAVLKARKGRIALPLKPRRVICLWIGQQEEKTNP